MKKLMLLALVAISINVSAQMRGNDPVWLQTGEKNFTNWVDAADKAQAPAVFAKYVNLPWEERLAKLEEVSGTFKFISLGKWEGNGVAQRDERNIGVKMYVISLAKEFKNKNYGDRVVPMYAFESGKGAMDYNQTLVLSIDNNLNGIMDDLMRDPKTGKLGVRDNTSGRQPIPMVDMMALVDEVQGIDGNGNQNQGPHFVDRGNGYSVLVDGNGTPIKGADGFDIIQKSDAVTGSSGGQTPGGPQSSTAKTASIYKVVTVDGNDPDLVAQLNGSGQQGGAADQLPPGCHTLPNGLIVCKETVNGIETRTVYTPDGQAYSMDDNSSMANIDMGKGRKVLTSGNNPVFGNMPFANKFGVGDFAGAAGNRGMGKNGGTWGNWGGQQVQLGWYGGQMVPCPAGYMMGANNCWIPMVGNGGCFGGNVTLVGTTLMNRQSPLDNYAFKQNALAASQASHAEWRARNPFGSH